jgi:uncharacterized protein YjbJ (UPF0337 family)
MATPTDPVVSTDVPAIAPLVPAPDVAPVVVPADGTAIVVPVTVVDAPVAPAAPAPVAAEALVPASVEVGTLLVDPATSAAAKAATEAGVPVDVTDPSVVLLAWFIVQAVRKVAGEKAEQIRFLLPVITVVAAVAVRALADVMQGHPLDQSTLFRAVAAAGITVLAHSQYREVQKVRAVRKVMGNAKLVGVAKDVVGDVVKGVQDVKEGDVKAVIADIKEVVEEIKDAVKKNE